MDPELPPPETLSVNIEALSLAAVTPSSDPTTPPVVASVRMAFACPKDFSDAHLQGSKIELENDLLHIRQFNEARKEWKISIVAPVSNSSSMRGYQRQWLALVDCPLADIASFPKPGDIFKLALLVSFIVNGTKVDPGYLDAERIDNPFTNPDSPLSHMAAIHLTMPAYYEKSQEINLLARYAMMNPDQALDTFEMDHVKQLVGVVRQEAIITTYIAENAALAWLTLSKSEGREDKPSDQSIAAFKWLLDFSQPPSRTVNLFTAIPHMQSPHLNNHIPSKLRRQFELLNDDHKSAYAGFHSIPAGLHMISGCPGAGKTSFNLLVAAIAISQPWKKRVKVLYVIDINQPLDDAANRMAKLCREAGMKRRIIRMRGWPREMKASSRLNLEREYSREEEKDASKTGDFTNQFLAQASKMSSSRPNDPVDLDKAPSLDEAAWEHYELHQHTRYKVLSRLLDKLAKDGIQDGQAMATMRRKVCDLYRDVIRKADFIATTPVATWGEFSNIYKPSIVFMDESPHARELTSLIPIAYFDPLVWVLSGDYRQTRPFVATKPGSDNVEGDGGAASNPFAEQLATSTMERAEATGLMRHSLMINHRAHGNLHLLPSRVFYGGKMVSAHANVDDMFPTSVKRLQQWLGKLLHGKPAFESRIMMQFPASREKKQFNSWWNPIHQAWVLIQAQHLLEDEHFCQLGPTTKPGTIMIIAPYRAAVSNYKAAVAMLGGEACGRIDVRTVDTAQGHEADVVFVDLVRTRSAGFMDDAHRLNVAITRARQAEILLMESGMLLKRQKKGTIPIRTTYLQQVFCHYVEKNLYDWVYRPQAMAKVEEIKAAM